MSAPTVQKISLDLIEMGKRLRDPHHDDVRAIELSMADVGLLTPISVRSIKGGKYRVIFGAHRYIAAQNLHAAGVPGWHEIDAFVVECDDYEAKLREIEENLKRVELTPQDQATFMFESLLLWEEKNGQAQHGGDRKSNSKRSELEKGIKKPGFFSETSKRIGLDETTIRLAVNRRRKASDELWALIKGTDASRKGIVLDRLLKTADPLNIIELAQAEYDGKIELALDHKAPKEKSAPKVESILKIVDAALAQWSDKQKREFFAGMRDRKP